MKTPIMCDAEVPRVVMMIVKREEKIRKEVKEMIEQMMNQRLLTLEQVISIISQSTEK